MNRNTPREAIIDDFDTIARETPNEYRRNHNNQYHALLLRYLPQQRRSVLDIGCGTGDLLELLLPHFNEATGVDFSHEMISRAKTRFRMNPKAHLLETEFFDISIANRYDLIISVATFHHLPLKETLLRSRNLLNQDGVLILLDLYKPSTLLDYALSALSIPANLINRYTLGRYGPQSDGERTAWERHGRHDCYHSMKDVRHSAKEILPGAMVKALLYWRYLLVWRNTKEQT